MRHETIYDGGTFGTNERKDDESTMIVLRSVEEKKLKGDEIIGIGH